MQGKKAGLSECGWETYALPTNPQVFDRSAHARCFAASISGFKWVEDVFMVFSFDICV